jgi:hypothetical protein
MKKRSVILLSACALFAASTAPAVVVVDFTNAATTVESAAGRDVDTASGDAWSFRDTGTPLFSGTSDGSNTRIWGGLTTTWTPDNAAYNPPMNLLTNGRLYIQNTGGAAGTYSTTATGMLIWKKENFLAGANAQTVQFGAEDTLTVGWTQIVSTSHDMRFVVQQGGTYYVSNANYTDAVANQTGTTAENWSIYAAATTWAPINTSTYAIGSFSSLALTDVTAVGLYMNASRTSQQVIISLRDFQADATAIPEPSAYAALIGLGALGLVAFRRRRQKRA